MTLRTIICSLYVGLTHFIITIITFIIIIIIISFSLFIAQVVPGDNATLEIDLIHAVPMSKGLRFALREGGRTVGSGLISELIA